jgi:hypothetical protein
MGFIRFLLCKLLGCKPQPQTQSPWVLRLWSPENPQFIVQGDNLMTAVLNPGQRIGFAVEPRDRHNNPAQIDGPVRPEADNPLVTATVNDDGLSGYFHLAADADVSGGPQAVLAQVKFDSRLGDEVNEVVMSGTILIGPPEATAENSVISFGDPEDEPTE